MEQYWVNIHSDLELPNLAGKMSLLTFPIGQLSRSRIARKFPMFWCDGSAGTENTSTV